jgi:metallo-beta-lactamase family protein
MITSSIIKIDKLKRKVYSTRHSVLDSPMAIKATFIFKEFKELHNVAFLTHEQYDDPLDFPGLEMVESAHKSREIKLKPGPKVIIAGSGMMSGGRILSHAVEFLPLENTRTHCRFSS